MMPVATSKRLTEILLLCLVPKDHILFKQIGDGVDETARMRMERSSVTYIYDGNMCSLVINSRVQGTSIILQQSAHVFRFINYHQYISVFYCGVTVA